MVCKFCRLRTQESICWHLVWISWKNILICIVLSNGEAKHLQDLMQSNSLKHTYYNIRRLALLVFRPNWNIVLPHFLYFSQNHFHILSRMVLVLSDLCQAMSLNTILMSMQWLPKGIEIIASPLDLMPMRPIPNPIQWHIQNIWYKQYIPTMPTEEAC